jgi:hypothetical protein
MSIDAIVILEQLRCITLKNTETRTEPYIWPALIKVDDHTISTSPNLLEVIANPIGGARVEIKDSMREGETAAIPSSVGILRARFEDNLNTRSLNLIVALLESDETPRDSIEAGYKAFTSELRVAVGERLIELRDANDVQTKKIVEEIQKRVGDKVTTAIRNSLSTGEKIRVFIGTLDMDDPSGSDFLRLSKADKTPDGRSLPDRLEPRTFTLNFEAKGKTVIPGAFPPTVVESLTKYEIRGRLEVKPVVIDKCQAQVNAVNAAKSSVKDVENEIKRLQAQLSGHHDPNDPPMTKADIIKEINRVRTEDLPVAEAALKSAQKELLACRTRVADTVGGGVVVG